MRLVTGIAVRLGGEAHKGCGLAAPLASRWCGWRWRRLRSDTVAWPHPLEHETQPHEGDQHQLIEKEIRDHGKTPSYRWRNESILPGFQTAGISRRLEGHDRFVEVRTVGEIPPMTETLRTQILANLGNAPILMALLPPEHFVFCGFIVLHALEVTDQEVLSSIKRDPIDRESLISTAHFHSLQTKLRTL